MRPSQIDFFPDGVSENGPSNVETLAANLWNVSFQAYAEDGETPVFTATLYGRLRKERLTSPSYAPNWVQLAQIENDTPNPLVAVTTRADELKVEITNYTGTGKVFALVSGHNVGSM